MSRQTMFLTAMGAVTPLAPYARLNTATVEAGLNRLQDHPFLTDGYGEPVIVGRAQFIDEDLSGKDRLMALGLPALNECLASIPQRRNNATIPLILTLSDARPGLIQGDLDSVRGQFASVEGIHLQECHAGTSRAFEGLKEARKLLGDGHDYVILGGVDSYYHPDTIHWLEQEGRLFCSHQETGLIPGEAGAFCLFTKNPGDGAIKYPRILREDITNVNGDPKTGKSLAELFQGLCEDLPEETKLEAIFCNLNGEQDRVEEYMAAYMRAHQWFDDPAAYLAPVDLWGDVGAAWVPLLLQQYHHQANSGQMNGKPSLLWTTEGSSRGAALIEV